jgi:hypothetical protein
MISTSPCVRHDVPHARRSEADAVGSCGQLGEVVSAGPWPQKGDRQRRRFDIPVIFPAQDLPAFNSEVTDDLQEPPAISPAANAGLRRQEDDNQENAEQSQRPLETFPSRSHELSPKIGLVHGRCLLPGKTGYRSRAAISVAQ